MKSHYFVWTLIIISIIIIIVVVVVIVIVIVIAFIIMIIITGSSYSVIDILKEETLPFCISCHSYGHRTTNCPTHPQVNQSFRRSPAQPQPLTASSTSSPTSTPKSSITTPPATLSASPPNLICRDFNRRFCRRVNCQFQHICSNQGCGGIHPSTQCPKGV